MVHDRRAHLERRLGEVLVRVGVDEHIELLDVALVEAPQQLAEPLDRVEAAYQEGARVCVRVRVGVFGCAYAWVISGVGVFGSVCGVGGGGGGHAT